MSKLIVCALIILPLAIQQAMSIRTERGSDYKITTHVIFLCTHRFVDSFVLLVSFSLIFVTQRQKKHRAKFKYSAKTVKSS